MSHEILDIREIVEIDDLIGSFEYIGKVIDQGTANLAGNNVGEISITFSGNNQWMRPGKVI